MGDDVELHPIGARIQELARALKLSLRALALKCELHPETLRVYVVKGRAPSTDALVALAKGTGASLQWLLTGEGSMLENKLDGRFKYDGSRTYGGEPVVKVAPDVFRLYSAVKDLPDAELAEDIRRVIRIRLGRDPDAADRVSVFLQGADPGEKKAGLAGSDGKARLASVGGRTPDTEDG